MAVSNQEFLVTNVPDVDSLKPKILSYRQQGPVLDKWLEKRIEKISVTVLHDKSEEAEG